MRKYINKFLIFAIMCLFGSTAKALQTVPADQITGTIVSNQLDATIWNQIASMSIGGDVYSSKTNVFTKFQEIRVVTGPPAYGLKITANGSSEGLPLELHGYLNLLKIYGTDGNTNELEAFKISTLHPSPLYFQAHLLGDFVASNVIADAVSVNKLIFSDFTTQTTANVGGVIVGAAYLSSNQTFDAFNTFQRPPSTPPNMHVVDIRANGASSSQQYALSIYQNSDPAEALIIYDANTNMLFEVNGRGLVDMISTNVGSGLNISYNFQVRTGVLTTATGIFTNNLTVAGYPVAGANGISATTNLYYDESTSKLHLGPNTNYPYIRGLGTTNIAMGAGTNEVIFPW